MDQLGWSGEETTLLDALSCLSSISFKSAILALQQAKDKQMKNLTTPQAILCGFALIALAIASIPYSSNIVSPAHAYRYDVKTASDVQKVTICGPDGVLCGLGVSLKNFLPLAVYINPKQQNVEGPIPVTVDRNINR